MKFRDVGDTRTSLAYKWPGRALNPSKVVLRNAP